ncbi:MAG TPA: M1 family aminopeptidase [Thermoanaerobaculia bacterium]|nr:M1 family aminopeptidase [Thermoanaerobaculia bacterium]
MLSAIARFELRYHLRAPLFYILVLVFFLLTFGAVTTDGVQIGGAVGNINRNSPFVIMQFMAIMSIFGILTTTAFVANAVHRDLELGTDSLFFSAPIKKTDYLGGRFLGSFIIAVLVFLGVSSAILIGSLMPWIEKERLGPFMPSAYLFSFGALVIPNLLLAGAIFFAVAALTRSMMATYSSVVGFFVLWGIASFKLSDIQNEKLAAMLDPFGLGAFSIATRYWTVFDKNTKLLPLSGVFLWNRLAWMGVAFVILAFAFWRFQFTTGTKSSRKKRAVAAADEQATQRVTLAMPSVHTAFGAFGSWRQFFNAVRVECTMVFKSIPFWIILFLGMGNIWGNSTGMNVIFGAPVFPVTHLMVQLIDGSFSLFALVIAAFYAGDIVWRERTLKLHEVYDAMPQRTWVTWAAKLTALTVVLYSTLAGAVLTSILIQTGKGYHNYELAVYAKGVFLQTGLWYLMIIGIAFVMQILFNQKFVGFVGVMVYFVVSAVLPALGHEHRLYRVATRVPATYSDMNGFGHFTKPLIWFDTYWLIFIGILLVAGHLLWVRGTETAMRARLRNARQRFHAPAIAALTILVIGFVSTGCYIYYNTNVLNHYRSSKDGEKLQAEIEKKYKKYEGFPQPRITDVQADVDLYPERRAVDIRGSYALLNKTDKPISELHVTFDPQMDKMDISVPGAKLKSDDEDHGYRIYTLAQPLAPGASTKMTFHTAFEANGFVNGGSNIDVVYNGTFINNFTYFPHLGYIEATELQDRNKRRKYDLKPIERLKPPTDMKARGNNLISRESDWLNLDTTVSTVPDQIAIAPGYLQKEWTANGRRYFRYKTTSPILGFWSYLSAHYTVKRDHWNDVPIEIYYDAKHPYNVDRMIDSVKKSLDYCTKNFSPYQHKQVRILEFPGYQTFAQSFPNTIPFSESIGFIADFRNDEDIDYVFYVTAHEVAHQWWAHQVIGGNVQGVTMLDETLAQYTALMVMEKEYGKDKMKKFLRYELDRYLSGRGGELVAEMPLSLVENQQYIHYRKGSLVMYALRDYIGEDKVNAALSKFTKAHAFEQPPYTTSPELVQYFRAEAPPEYQNVITDLFERITLFDLEAKDVKSTKRKDGKYDVTVTVTAKKLYGDAKGEEKETKIDDWIDVGVLAKNPKAKNNEDDLPLLVEKKHITQPLETFQFVVNREPNKAGIDPFNKLIDRNPKDNVKSF